MKRFGVYAFIIILVVSIVSGSAAPTVANAATYDVTTVTAADYNNLKTIANDIEAQVDFSSSLGQRHILAKKYLDILDTAYVSTKDIVTTTKSSLEVQVLNEFIAYLNQRLEVSTSSGEKDDINRVIILARQKFSYAVTRVQAENGTLSSDEVKTQNAATVAVTKNAYDERTKALDAAKCKITDFSLVDCVDVLFAWLIKNTLLQIGGFFVWLTANMLNLAIQLSILEFSKWAPPELYPLWVIVRQIVSLFVVFAGLYLGFMYIIGRTEAFGKFIGWLVLFALFVNFSYPFSRALVDISNIVSLNIYSAAVGPNSLTTNFSSAATTLGADTAGAIIMNKLGLQELAVSATNVQNAQAGFVKDINSTPGALLAVAFVFYAAYIFFMATAIIVVRTFVLVFLIVASPILLVDSVIPKLGDAAVKIRKAFFEQLVVAPVFMIMLALTLKFMDVFTTAGRLAGATAGSLTGGADSVKTFFSVLMMLVMLHIMLKVTKSVAGQAGEFATNMMGKVGGFGLGVAAGGAGILARGTIGAGAARLRDSAWMDKMKSSSVGRGMYGLTNSLAQSTYDARNVGFVGRGMATAGLTGVGGLGMQKGIKQGYDERKKSREEEVAKFGSNIRDDATRSSYFSNINNGRLVRVDEARMREMEREVKAKRDAQMTALAGADSEKRKSLIDQAILAKDHVMTERLKAGDAYLNVKNTDLGAADRKAEELRKMGMDDEEVKNFVNKKDPFADLQKVHEENIKQMERSLATMKRGTEEEKKAYSAAQAKIGETKKAHEENIENLRKATLDAYSGTPTSSASPSPASTQQSSTGAASGPPPVQIPAVQRAANANFPPRPSTVQPSSGPSGESANQSQNGTSPVKPSFVARPSSAPASGGAPSNQTQREPAQNVQPPNRPTIEPGPSGTYTFNGVNYASYPDAIAARRVHLQTNNMTNSGMSTHGMPSATPPGTPVVANKQAEPVTGAL